MRAHAHTMHVVSVRLQQEGVSALMGTDQSRAVSAPARSAELSSSSSFSSLFPRLTTSRGSRRQDAILLLPPSVCCSSSRPIRPHTPHPTSLTPPSPNVTASTALPCARHLLPCLSAALEAHTPRPTLQRQREQCLRLRSCAPCCHCHVVCVCVCASVTAHTVSLLCYTTRVVLYHTRSSAIEGPCSSPEWRVTFQLPPTGGPCQQYQCLPAALPAQREL